jgi:hypothetical protein
VYHIFGGSTGGAPGTTTFRRIKKGLNAINNAIVYNNDVNHDVLYIIETMIEK